MIALIRSDAYRVAHSRWIWALAAIVAVLVVAPPIAMRWAGGWPASYANLTGDALAMGGVQMLAAAMAAIVCCDRTDIGFSRSVLSSLSGRGRIAWFAGKCAFSLLLAAALVAFTFAMGLLALLASGIPVADPEPAWQVAAWLGCMWLSAAPYVALTVLVAHLTRSEGVTVAFAVLSAGGLVEGGLLAGADLLYALAGGEFLTVTSAVGPWLPVEIASAASAGASTLLSADGVTHLAPAVRALIVCLPVAVAAIAADVLVVSRRDAA